MLIRNTRRMESVLSVCVGGRWKLVMFVAVLSSDRETQDLMVLLEETAPLESRLDTHPANVSSHTQSQP